MILSVFKGHRPKVKSKDHRPKVKGKYHRPNIKGKGSICERMPSKKYVHIVSGCPSYVLDTGLLARQKICIWAIQLLARSINHILMRLIFTPF